MLDSLRYGTLTIRYVSRYLSHNTIHIAILAENCKMCTATVAIKVKCCTGYSVGDIDSPCNGLVYALFIDKLIANKCQGTDSYMHITP